MNYYILQYEYANNSGHRYLRTVYYDQTRQLWTHAWAEATQYTWDSALAMLTKWQRLWKGTEGTLRIVDRDMRVVMIGDLL